jgi:hypothetical protein
VGKNAITEYVERNSLSKSAQVFDYVEFYEGSDNEDFANEYDKVIDYKEESGLSDIEDLDDDLLHDFESSLDESVEGSDIGELNVIEFDEESDESFANDDLSEDTQEDESSNGSSALDSVRMLPGSSMSLADDDDDDKKDDDAVGTWKDDMDVRDFMNYMHSAYTNIPKHDGTTILGCERAINYLKDLDRETSKAISMDKNMALDVGALDTYRVNMMKDMMTLKDHIKKLQRGIREQHGKKAFEDHDMKTIGADQEIVKEATVARIQLVVTPFERALSGMIINSVVSAGKSFEDVYDVLKKKYKLTDREELALIQLIADMGYPIFKDRGSIGDPSVEIDFIKNYLA